MGILDTDFVSLAGHEKLQLGERKEILYEGVYYDVSNFIEKHPGGQVIEVLVHSREDATLHVQQFHHRSIKKVLTMMKSLPQRKATDEDIKSLGMDQKQLEKHKILTQDFLELFETFKKEGLFDPNPFHVFCRTFEVVFLTAFGLILLRMQPLHLIPRIIGIISVALGMGRGGWVMHEGNHISLLGIPKWDRFIGYYFLGFLGGLSNSYWNFQHTRHHAAPQHVKYDTDMEEVPLAAFNRKKISKPEDDIFGVIRHQKLLFIPVLTFFMMMGWKFVKHPYHCYIHGIYSDIILIVAHHIVYIGCAGLINYLLIVYLFAIYFFVSAHLSHSHLPEAEEPTHWVEYALTHTANVRSSWWVDYWMGNLNYQIEHHLFPTMPQYKNKLCRDRVKALAKKHNLPYHLFSFREAVVKCLDNFGNVAKEL